MRHRVIRSEPNVNDIAGRYDVWRSDVSTITTDVTRLGIATVVYLEQNKTGFEKPIILSF